MRRKGEGEPPFQGIAGIIPIQQIDSPYPVRVSRYFCPSLENFGVVGITGINDGDQDTLARLKALISQKLPGSRQVE